MIPKIIHLCWLSGDKYPAKIAKCIASWKKNLPDYEIMLWDTKRFDLNSSNWVKQAFEAKKYAFAADYIRFYALYNYGGVYLDSDVEVLKSFNPLLDLPYFVGAVQPGTPEAAIMGAEKVKEMATSYGKKEEELNKNEALKEYISNNIKTEKAIELIIKNAKIKK